jgi:hypothetical protein
LIATLRQNFLDHKEFLKSATDKYDISLRVFELLSYLTLLHEYVLLLPESNKKEIIKSRYHYLEMIYFNYQRLSYYIKGFIDYEIATNDHIMNGLNSKIKIDFDFTPLHVNHNLYLKAYQYIIQIGNFKAQCEKEIFENS